MEWKLTSTFFFYPDKSDKVQPTNFQTKTQAAGCYLLLGDSQLKKKITHYYFWNLQLSKLTNPRYVRFSERDCLGIDQ